MGYHKLSSHDIKIGRSLISLSEEVVIDKVQEISNKVVFNTYPSETGLDWTKSTTHNIWKERVQKNPPSLYVYDQEGILLWEFPYKEVVGYEVVLPENKTELEFITPEHYKKYIERFAKKELLIIYAGDFRYRVDANTGEIYGENESR